MVWKGFQGTGFGNCGCGGVDTSSCLPSNCSSLCTALFIQNSWNVPAVNANATLTAPSVKNIIVGAYLWNPTYGYYKIISFDAITYQIIVTNEGTSGNSAPGTIIPANTIFSVSPPPISNIIDFSGTIAFTATGALTFVVSTLNSAKYSRIGPKLIWFEVDVVGTTGGTTNKNIMHTLPVTALSADVGGFAASVLDSTLVAGMAALSDTTHNQISKYDLSNFGLGAGRRLKTSGIYEAA